MRMVTLGATGPEVIPLANGTWQLGRHWGPVDERAATEAIGHARSPGTSFSGTGQASGSGQVEETRAGRC
jgi:aryl-alcohol dehydrogenase-like predicted oxidoreductase